MPGDYIFGGNLHSDHIEIAVCKLDQIVARHLRQRRAPNSREDKRLEQLKMWK